MLHDHGNVQLVIEYQRLLDLDGKVVVSFNIYPVLQDEVFIEQNPLGLTVEISVLHEVIAGFAQHVNHAELLACLCLRHLDAVRV